MTEERHKQYPHLVRVTLTVNRYGHLELAAASRCAYIQYESDIDAILESLDSEENEELAAGYPVNVWLYDELVEAYLELEES